jgi:hypothetical protein
MPITTDFNTFANRYHANDTTTNMPDKIYMAFWKGTPWPQLLSFNPDNFQRFEQMAYSMIVKGLQMGDSLDEQANHYKTQMDDFESWLSDWNARMSASNQTDVNWKYTPTKNERLSVDIEKTFGYSMDFIGAIWYANVAALLKMKKIQNDENFGWLIVDKKVATLLSG